MFITNMIYGLSQDTCNVEMYRLNVILLTGAKVKMKIALCDKARVLRSASNIAINLWDDLDVNVQNAGSFIKFRQ